MLSIFIRECKQHCIVWDEGENTPVEPDNQNNSSDQQDIWNVYQCGVTFSGFVFLSVWKIMTEKQKLREKRKETC